MHILFTTTIDIVSTEWLGKKIGLRSTDTFQPKIRIQSYSLRLLSRDGFFKKIFWKTNRLFLYRRRQIKNQKIFENNRFKN